MQEYKHRVVDAKTPGQKVEDLRQRLAEQLNYYCQKLETFTKAEQSLQEGRA